MTSVQPNMPDDDGLRLVADSAGYDGETRTAAARFNVVSHRWWVDVTIDGATGDVVSMGIEADPGHPITARRLQRLPIGALQRRLRQALIEAMRVAAGENPAVQDDASERIDALEHPRRTQSNRPGPRGLSDLEKAQLAIDYVDQVVNGGMTMADFAKRHYLSPTGISSRIANVRRDGFLTDSGTRRIGKPYGEATSLALRTISADKGGAQ